MVQHPVAPVKEKLLLTHGNLRRQDAPVVARASQNSLARATNPGSRLGVMLFPGTSQERSISSRSLALSLFEHFAPFLQFSRRRSNASTSLSALVSAESGSAILSRALSGARRYGHSVDSAWKGRRAGGAEEVPMRGAGSVGGRGGRSRRSYDWNRLGRSWDTRRDGYSRS